MKPSLLFPKAFLKMAGLLAYPNWRLPSRPAPDNYRDGTVAKGCRQHERLTAAGTAPVFHRIPFCCEPFSLQR